jgi:bile acid:Na+ symporter, BASS family
MKDRLLGGGDRGICDALALGTGSRNVAAALLAGAQNFQDARVNVMVIVSAVVGLGILLPTARALGKHVSGATGVVSPAATERKHSIKEKLV